MQPPRPLNHSEPLLMKTKLLVASTLVCLVIFVNVQPALTKGTPPAAFETRCGWFANPTPANVWLYDREGQWIIGVQGDYQTPGDWPWPKFKKGQWVVTNAGDKGYGCACFQMRVNKETNEVLEIKSSRGRPLAQCRNDASLKKVERTLK